MAELAPPVRVSPFIRACRYGAFFTGIVFGSLRFRYLKRKETRLREYRTKQKAIMDAKRAEEKRISDRNEMIYLAKESGIPVPPNF